MAIEDYEKNLNKLVARMKKTGAKLVWRNTTPVPPGSKGRYVGDSVLYNEAAARVMKKHEVPTLDLFYPKQEEHEDVDAPRQPCTTSPQVPKHWRNWL